MAERRVGVRVSVTGRDTDEFRNMARDAGVASAAIKAIPNRVTVRADTSGLSKIERDAQRAQRSGSLLVDTLGMLAPTVAPLSAVAVAGLGALSAQAAAAVGSVAPLLLATNGLGDALKALEAARLEPTVENLQAADTALASLPEQTAAFARRLQSLRPLVGDFQQTSAAGLFPGVSAGLDALLTRSDEVETVLGRLAEAQGELAQRAGESLSGPEWDAFFEMVDRDAKPTLLDLGSTVGSLGSSLANVATGLAPLNREIGAGIADWADNLERLSRDADYEAFMAYVRENGPQVIDTLGALGGAALDLAMAAGELGGPTLAIIEASADALGAIADSPAGPALFATAAGFAAINRVLAVRARLQDSLAAQLVLGQRGVDGGGQSGLVAMRNNLNAGRVSVRRFRSDVATIGTTWATAGATSQREAARVAAASGRVRTSLSRIGRGAAPIAAIGVATSGVADSFGLANSATLALAGSMAGPLGAAAGGTIGLMLDVASATDRLKAAQSGLASAMATGDIEAQRARLAELQQAVDQPVTGSGSDFIDSQMFGFNLLKLGYAKVSGEVDRGRDAIREAKAEMRENSAANQAAAAQGALADGYRLTASSALAARDGVFGFNGALSESQTALNGFLAAEAYRTSVQGLDKALRENRRTLNANTEAGKANRAALTSLARDALTQAEALGENKGYAFLQRARQEAVQFAMDMGQTRQQARALADELGLFQRAVFQPAIDLNTRGALAREEELRARLERLGKMKQTPEVRAKTDQAEAALSAVLSRLSAIRNREVTITTYHRDVGIVRQTGGGSATRIARADGGTVPGVRYPYGDKVLAYLAPGEEVITNRNGEADRFRRDRAAGRIPAYADGGMVQAYAAGGRPSPSPRVNVAAPNVNLGNTTVMVQLDGMDRYIEGRIVEVNQADARFERGRHIGR
ncbi:hypothetical protein GCM10027425_12500 [Alteromonas gracilis]